LHGFPKGTIADELENRSKYAFAAAVSSARELL